MKPYTPQPREYYISKCRYYNGGDEENTLPSPDKIFASFERCWVDLHYTEDGIDELRENIRAYKEFGRGLIKENDGVPIALKAHIWTRYIHWGTGLETPADFIRWFRGEYLKEHPKG